MPSAAEIKRLTEYIAVAEVSEGNRVSFRGAKPIEIVEHNPDWPAHFALIASRIRDATSAVVAVEHVGSTSVPGMPAKPIIDVDVTVADPTDEDAYVPALEAAGFQFLFREPRWHEHRFFGLKEPYANIHIFGPDSPELTRHAMFRDWLKEHADEREIYARAKREAAAASRAAGENTRDYNKRKHGAIHAILTRMFRAHGLYMDETAEEK